MSKSHALLTKPSTAPHEAWQSYSSVTLFCSFQTEPLFIWPRQLLVRQKGKHRWFGALKQRTGTFISSKSEERKNKGQKPQERKEETKTDRTVNEAEK